MKLNKKIEIVKRIELNGNEIKKSRESRYLKLKEKLKILIKEESYNKIETARILKEINDNKYYVIDKYKSFGHFIKDYNMAKTTVYRYIKLAIGIDSGKINYELILKKGIYYAMQFLENNETIVNSKRILNRSLRLKIEDEKSLNFYKSNTNFVSFLLKELYYDNQKLLINIKNKYDNLKNKK
ncbi:chromosome replication/partitioning protein [Borreliella burgdorferi]|uniref:PF-49 protein n=2 Tax=Borreliella burgdorferi TaxID=139 RepID=A0A9N7G4I1_BORBG|nr:chromosome replication/partitioning protein [Borreliella burgdorferi]ACK75417.1 putative plasmid partition protein [Borreliella burgdorferi ZS7]ACL34276.1 putative plasmid partition protein [Borreliella burgdorferi 156a]ACN24351.1 putative plasmid partition protein [Borreliella burgdorferi 64b]ACO37878.1 putative plasmid partition protein [Borreliella burgdorferi Bol26]ADQ31280.1 putative plasmid partition protein [Borreliella burgdorferi JD1]